MSAPVFQFVFESFIVIFHLIFSISHSIDNNTPDSPLQVLNYPGSAQEKDRKLSEMILQLQMVREHLRSSSERVSRLFFEKDNI